jgi:hypothetical protein
MLRNHRRLNLRSGIRRSYHKDIIWPCLLSRTLLFLLSQKVFEIVR